MAVPKRKTSKSRRNKRRAQHDKVTAPQLSECPSCGELRIPHRICPSCGFYKGRRVIEMEEMEE
jgi:large subunit ribosomal protein L32